MQCANRLMTCGVVKLSDPHHFLMIGSYSGNVVEMAEMKSFMRVVNSLGMSLTVVPISVLSTDEDS